MKYEHLPISQVIVKLYLFKVISIKYTKLNEFKIYWNINNLFKTEYIS